MDYFMNFAIGFVAGGAIIWFLKPKIEAAAGKLFDIFRR